MLLTAFIYSLGALSGVLSAAGAFWLFQRVTLRPLDQQSLRDALADLAELKLTFAGFADQYELTYIRNAAKLGKLRRALAKERGEDIEDPEEASGQVPADLAAAAVEMIDPNDKATLWARARERGVA